MFLNTYYNVQDLGLFILFLFFTYCLNMNRIIDEEEQENRMLVVMSMNQSVNGYQMYGILTDSNTFSIQNQ